MIDTLSVTSPVARKEHKCEWCGEKIEKGEKYSRWVGVDAGVFACVKMHNECAQAFSEAFHDDGQEEYEPYSYKRGQKDQR